MCAAAEQRSSQLIIVVGFFTDHHDQSVSHRSPDVGSAAGHVTWAARIAVCRPARLALRAGGAGWRRQQSG